MKINKKEIIDEIILLEPKLANDRKKLENILEDIINIKPNIKISKEFKNELKEKLLTRIKGNSEIYKSNKFNYLKLFISFLFWGITAFSLVWILWINLDFLSLDKSKNIESVWIMQFQEFPESKMRGIMPMWAEISTMSINVESVDDASIVMDEEFVNNYDLITEIRNYLDSLNLDPLVIQKIIDIIKKYN